MDFKNDKVVLVVDTSAIIAGFNLTFSRLKVFTPPSILDEAMKKLGEESLQIEAIKIGGIIVRDPSEEYKQKVMETSKELGEFQRLSREDLTVLSLALELRETGFKPVVITNDYAIQNVAGHLKIIFASMGVKGISWLFRWKWICPSCGLTYREGIKVCTVCGSGLKRKALWRSRK